MKPLVVIIVFLSLFTSACFAQESSPSEDQVTIQNMIESYVDAFNRQDIEGLLSYWAQDGDYIDVTGRIIQGRDAIRKEYEGFFQSYFNPTLSITVVSTRFAGDSTAIEDGIREVSFAGAAPNRNIRYTVVYVKKNGRLARAKREGRCRVRTLELSQSTGAGMDGWRMD